MVSRLRYLARQVFSRLPAILPNSCVLCGKSGDAAVCARCKAEHFVRPRPCRCMRCAAPLPVVRTTSPSSAGVCGSCLTHPPPFDATIVAIEYCAPVDQLVLALKFGHRLAHASLFAQALRDAVLQTPGLPLPSVMCAVPLGPQRLAERGFNQALEIARPLSRALGIGLEPNLVARLRDTRAQTLLRPDERGRNVRQAFMVPDAARVRIRGRHIGVVDDVITTGATLHELAATLKRFGAARVTNFVFARTAQK